MKLGMRRRSHGKMENSSSLAMFDNVREPVIPPRTLSYYSPTFPRTIVTIISQDVI